MGWWGYAKRQQFLGLGGWIVFCFYHPRKRCCVNTAPGMFIIFHCAMVTVEIAGDEDDEYDDGDDESPFSPRLRRMALATAPGPQQRQMRRVATYCKRSGLQHVAHV